MKKLHLLYAFLLLVATCYAIHPPLTPADATRVHDVHIKTNRSRRIVSLDKSDVLRANTGILTVASPPALAAGEKARELMRSSCIRFTENRGQIVDTEGNLRKDILFTAKVSGARLYFRRDGISYVFTNTESTALNDSPKSDVFVKGTARRFRCETYRLDMTLDGCNRDARIRAEGELSGSLAFYLPHCPDGITGVREYSCIVYEDVYENIDFEFFSSEGKVKYNFIVHPGGRVDDIRMRYDASADLDLTIDGRLAVSTPLGEVEEAKPYTYAGDINSEIPSRFLRNGNTVSFAVETYNPYEMLVIDPFATYYGGSDDDRGRDVAIDGNGNIIIAGITYSANFPVDNGWQTSMGGTRDAFIVKFDQYGNRLRATYFGGNSTEDRSRIAVDGNGNIILAGNTASTDLPVTPGAFQTSTTGGDPFVAKFDGNCALLWATYYGGSSGELFADVATDGNGCILFSGSTMSKDFPVSSGAFQTKHGPGGGYDVFIVKMNGDGSRAWATYYGGGSAEFTYAICTDLNGNVFIAGDTGSGFPVTAGAFQTVHAGGGTDGFLVKMTSSGDRAWATYVGGSGSEYAGYGGLSADESGNVVYVSYTSSADFPVTAGAFQTVYGGAIDGFIAKFSGGGAGLWVTYCGGSGSDNVQSVAHDGSGNVVVMGSTGSVNFPTSMGAFMTVLTNGSDAFVMKLSAAGTRLWGTLYGGDGWEDHCQLEIDANENTVCAGTTSSTDLPVVNAFQNSNAGGDDAFVTVLDVNGLLPGYNAPPVAVAAATPEQGTYPLTAVFSSAGSYDPDGSIAAYYWDFGDGNSSTSANPTHVYQTAGVYAAVLTVTDNNNATANDDVTITVTDPNSFVYVYDQTVSRVKVGNKWKGLDLVTIYNGQNQAVSGATVTASYTGPNSGTAYGTTGATGTVTLETPLKNNPSGVWCFTVTGVQASGYTFNTGLGEITACEQSPKSLSYPTESMEVTLFPNPFPGSTVFHIKTASECSVRLRLFDLSGRAVASLFDGTLPSGVHAVPFNTGNLPAGAYLWRLEAGDDFLTGAVFLSR